MLQPLKDVRFGFRRSHTIEWRSPALCVAVGTLVGASALEGVEVPRLPQAGQGRVLEDLHSLHLPAHSRAFFDGFRSRSFRSAAS